MDDSYRALPRTVEVFEAGLAEGLHIGAQAYVSVNGVSIADFGLGEARPGVPMSADTVMPWHSATKPVAAVAVAQLWERGKLDLDDRVIEFIPEFGTKGKDIVTLRHLLTHTSGLPSVEARWRPFDQAQGERDLWGNIIARISAADLESAPGASAAYHAASSWFILGEIVRRIDGRPYDRFAREEIFEPLGMMDSWLALSPERYHEYGDRIGIMQNTETGKPQPHPHWDTEEGAALCRPGGSGRGPMRELGAFYEMLLFRGQRQRVRVLSPQSVEALTAHHRVGMFDETFQHTIDWGLGFLLDSNKYGVDTVPYGYGSFCSSRTFGHSGFQSSTAFADPDHGLVVAVAANGTPGERRHQRRFRAITSAIYEDLGLAR